MKHLSFPKYNKLPPSLLNLVIYVNKKIMNEGIYNVNIDKLCKDLKLSKKTLYKYFKNKDEFIRACVLFYLYEIKLRIDKIENFKSKPLEYLINFYKILYEKVALLKPNILYEISVKYPQLWEEINEFRINIVGSLKPVLEKAQEENLIKKNLNLDFFIFLITSIVQNVFTPEVFVELNFNTKESLISLLEIIFTGIIEDDKKVNIRKLLSE